MGRIFERRVHSRRAEGRHRARPSRGGAVRLHAPLCLRA